MSNTKRSKKPAIIVGALAIYMIIMTIVNRETLTIHHGYLRYFGSLALEVVLLVVLFIVLTKREKLRAGRKKDLEDSSDKS